MNCFREITKMGVPPGNRPAAPRDWFRGVPKRYVAGADTRGRQEGRPYPWSQQVIHEISGLGGLAFIQVLFPFRGNLVFWRPADLNSYIYVCLLFEHIQIRFQLAFNNSQ